MHEVLTERRDESVDLGELLERLRAMLVQGLGGDKRVEASLEPVSLAGGRATALALVFSELLQNALEHGGARVRIELARRERRRLARRSPTTATGSAASDAGHGALDRRGARARRARRHARRSRDDGGLRAEVGAFPPAA